MSDAHTEDPCGTVLQIVAMADLQPKLRSMSVAGASDTTSDDSRLALSARRDRSLQLETRTGRGRPREPRRRQVKSRSLAKRDPRVRRPKSLARLWISGEIRRSRQWSGTASIRRPPVFQTLTITGPGSGGALCHQRCVDASRSTPSAEIAACRSGAWSGRARNSVVV